MGYDAACTLHLDGEAVAGKACLEQHALIFRGPVRLAIPLASIASATSGDGSLTVRFGRRVAIFDVGACAERWAARITSPPSRLEKLGIKPGMAIAAAGTIHADLLKEIRSQGVRVTRTLRTGGTDILFYGAERRAALDRLAALKPALKTNGALWVIRPKGSPAIAESDVMTAGKRAGLVDVKVVGFSVTHTAEKFVIPKRAR